MMAEYKISYDPTEPGEVRDISRTIHADEAWSTLFKIKEIIWQTRKNEYPSEDILHEHEEVCDDIMDLINQTKLDDIYL